VAQGAAAPAHGHHLFFNAGGPKGALSRGYIGSRLIFANLARFSLEAHEKKLKELCQLRDRLAGRFAHAGIPSREIGIADVWRLHHDLLNPERARARLAPPKVVVRDDLWSDSTIGHQGEHLAEYTEAEQARFRGPRRRPRPVPPGADSPPNCDPQGATRSGDELLAAEPLFSLATRDGEALRPFPYTLSVTVHVQHQGKARWILNTRHGLVDALKNAIPFLADKSIAKASADAAAQESIAALFRELNEMSSKLVTLSANLLLEADSPEQLDARTEAARASFSCMGNSQMLVEDVAQLPAFLSLLPGSGPYQVRKKGCTSRNAGDFFARVRSVAADARRPRASCSLRPTSSSGSTSSTRSSRPPTTAWWSPTPGQERA